MNDGDVARALKATAAAAARSVASLGHVRASRILFVYNPALKVRARVFPLAFDATGTRLSRDGRTRRPLVKVRGKTMRYVIEYGPSFLRAPPARRLETLVHELLHLSPFFNGTLSRAMRHSRADTAAFRARVRGAVGEIEAAGEGRGALLDFGAQPMCLRWMRPFELNGGGTYTEHDLVPVAVRISRP